MLGPIKCFLYLTKPFPDNDFVMRRVEGALEKATVRHQGTILLHRLERVLDVLEGKLPDAAEKGLSERVQEVADRMRLLISDLRLLGSGVR